MKYCETGANDGCRSRARKAERSLVGFKFFDGFVCVLERGVVRFGSDKKSARINKFTLKSEGVL